MLALVFAGSCVRHGRPFNVESRSALLEHPVDRKCSMCVRMHVLSLPFNIEEARSAYSFLCSSSSLQALKLLSNLRE